MILKRALTYASSLALAAAVAFPSLADEAPRFSNDGFLSEWRAFLEDEEKAAQKERSPGNINFNLGPSKDQASDFIVFKKPEKDEEENSSLRVSTSVFSSSSFTPSASLLSGELESTLLPGDSWLLNSFTPRYPTAHLRLGFIPGGDSGAGDSKFDITLNTQVVTSPTETFGPDSTGYLTESLPRQAYNVGMNVGYSGFRVGANLRGEEGAYFDGISGYDVGIAYHRPTWSTSLMFSEYRQANTYLLGLHDPLSGDTFFALEFGAAYRLNPWLKFVGAVRYYEDPNMLLLDPDALTISHLFYLGTNVNF